MIQVIIQPGSIQVTGHAAKDRPAMTWSVRRVSTLVQTFVRSAEELTDVPLHSDIAPGRAFVRYEGSPQAQLLADSFFWWRAVSFCALRSVGCGRRPGLVS